MIFKMERKQAIKLIAAGGMAVSLQGCIAAAFPLAAGGLMAGRGQSDAEATVASANDPAELAAQSAAVVSEASPEPTGRVEVGTGSASASGAFRVDAEAEAQTAVQSGAEAETEFGAAFGSVIEPPVNAEPAVVAATAVALPAAGPATEPVQSPSAQVAAPLAAEAAAVTASALTVSTPAPAPAPAPTTAVTPPPPAPAVSASASSSIVVPVPEAAPAVAGGTFFDPLFSYAGSAEFAGSGERLSAILRNPAMLEAERTQCSRGVSTVLIDLDPDSGELLPIDTQSASPALAQRLAQLRLQGVNIVWISENAIDKTTDIAVGLRDSGLDPLGQDQILLMRTSDDRKQSRRDELAGNSCLIAIAGDTRSDFHELFGYLLNPSDAVSLEPLIGEGWFLIPTPLLAERSAR